MTTETFEFTMKDASGTFGWLLETKDEQILSAVVTPKEIAEAFNVKEDTVRDAIEHGWLVARKSGATWLVLRKHAEKRWGKKKTTFTYYAKPLWDLTPSEYEGEIEKYVADLDKAYGDVIVNVVAPKGYELVEDDFARIEELINEK